MGNTPDVRVKLSAEGVEEVIRAFQQVSKAAQKVGETGQSVKLLNQTLGDLKSLLPQIGLAAAAGGLVALTKSALDGGEELAKLSKKTGVGVESLSVLTRAAVLADVGTEGLTKGLKKLSVSLVELQTGGGASAEGFRLLGLKAKDFTGLKTDAALIKIADAFKKLPGGIVQSTAAVKIFGKAGSDLIPLLQDIGGGGFDEFKKRLKELGLVMDQEVAAKAEQLNDELKLLSESAKGAALAFGIGASNSLIRLTQNMQVAAGESQKFFGSLGASVGFVVELLYKGVQGIGAFIGALSTLPDVLRGKLTIQDAKNGFLETVYGDIKKAQQDLPKLMADISAALDKTPIADRAGLRNRFADILGEKDVQVLVGRLQQLQKEIGASVKADAEAQTEAAALAQERAIKTSKSISQQAQANASSRLAETQARLRQDEELNKEAYSEQLQSADEFYAERIALSQKATAAEIEAMKKRKAAIQSEKLDPNDENAQINKAREVAQINSQIRVREIEGQTTVLSLKEEQRLKDEEIGKRRLEIEAQIQEVQGNTYQAAIMNIQRQAEELKKQGVDVGTIDRLAASLKSQALFKSLQQGGGNAAAAVANFDAHLQNQVAGGDIFPFEAAEKYREVLAATLPTLQEYAAAMKESAVTDEEVAAADQYANQVEALGVVADRSAQEMGKFKQAVEQSLNSDLTNFLTKGIDDAHDFGDAMRGLALSVSDSLRQISAQMLSTYLTEQLISGAKKLFGGSADAGKGKVADSAAAGAAQAAPLVGAAAGLTAAGATLTAAGTSLGVAGGAMVTGAGAVMASAVALQAAADALLIANSMSAAGGYAEGGVVFGPGTGTSDSIPARLSAGEFVVRAAAVAQPGVLPLLAHINRGMRTPALLSGAGPARFADGGLVSAQDMMGQGGQGGPAQVHIGIEEGMFVKRVVHALGTKEAGRVQIKQLSQNQKGANSALGRNS